MFILAGIFLPERPTEAAIGLLIACAGCTAIVVGAPWRHPATSYRVLMLPIYACFVAAVAWAVWATDDPRMLGFTGWSLFALLPALLPIWIVGGRRWRDEEPD